MLDIKFIKENSDIVKKVIEKRHLSFDVDAFLEVDAKRILMLETVENLRARQNKATEEIPNAGQERRNVLLSEMQVLKLELGQKEDELKEIMQEWQTLMLKIPNVPSADVPEGPDESGNVVVREWGEKPVFSFTPKEHYEIGEALCLIDTETAAKVASSRFSYIKGDLVRLQFALLQMCLGILSDVEVLKSIAKEANVSFDVTAPFMPVIPPVFIKPLVQVKMARFMAPEDHYLFPNDDLMLIGSAEHTLGSMHMDTIFTEQDLPIRYVGYSTAFRREAGTYGKDTNGILRQHQFDKLEMEVFSLPENSIQEQNFLVAIQEYILRALKLPHQVMLVCTGDMGFPDARQFDINTWMPGQNKYRETHSADLTGSFQSRRLNTRVRRANDKIEPVHMNDATAIAIGRTLIAIVENYQQEDGSIVIPEVLRPYMGGKEIIKK